MNMRESENNDNASNIEHKPERLIEARERQIIKAVKILG